MCARTEARPCNQPRSGGYARHTFHGGPERLDGASSIPVGLLRALSEACIIQKGALLQSELSICGREGRRREGGSEEEGLMERFGESRFIYKKLENDVHLSAAACVLPPPSLSK